ncbi:MAG: hypothetical protein R2909_17520 [Gemmatimonadales bacterium]
MRSIVRYSLVPVALTALLGFTTGSPAESDAVADPCATFTQAALNGYRSQLGQALQAAQADARANGSNGRYKVAATNARDLLQRSYDRAGEMLQFSQRSDPGTTTYVEAGNYKAYLQSILKWLPDAAHWATISAVYHRSQSALDAFDRSTAAITRGAQMMADAGRCYAAPYLSGAAVAG